MLFSEKENKIMKRILLRIIFVILAILAADMIILESLKRFGTISDPLQMAEETNSPNTNFLFASNASLPGRIAMTIKGNKQKPCINTVSSFFNRYYTCSNCEEFEVNPKKWNFEQVQKPQAGDIAIQHRSTGRAYHAVIITKIENGKYYVTHAVGTEYLKNVELKNKARLTFYRFTQNKK
jgi:hypothetical protein